MRDVFCCGDQSARAERFAAHLWVGFECTATFGWVGIACRIFIGWVGRLHDFTGSVSGQDGYFGVDCGGRGFSC